MQYINENDIERFSKYVKENKINLSYFNDENSFDFLIYAIEKDTIIKILEFIISNYSSLNYTCSVDWMRIKKPHSTNTNYQSPLFNAIANKKYNIARLLLKVGADINYKI
ncbi:hypothetical protein BCR36DRAFT_292946, partial [Piromyces finnis]